MKIECLFNQVFNLNKAFVFGGTGDKPSAQPETQSLSRTEVNREMIALAERHIGSANAVVKEAEDYLSDKDHLKDFREYEKTKKLPDKLKNYRSIFDNIIKVKGNIAKLQSAIRSGNLTMDMLKQSRDTMKIAGSGLAQEIGNSASHDPLGRPFNAYRPETADASYALEYSGPLTVDQAQDRLFRGLISFRRHSTSTGSWANNSYFRQYNRQLNELAAARQLRRNRGEALETDATLALGQELVDTISLSDAIPGSYAQEKPEAVLKRRALLTDRLLRQARASELKPGEYRDMGLVTIQKAGSGNAYLLSVAEGAVVDGKPMTIPRTVVIDMDFEGKRQGLEKEIAAAKARKSQPEEIATLQARYASLEPVGYDVFPRGGANDAERIASRASEKMWNDRYKKMASEQEEQEAKA